MKEEESKPKAKSGRFIIQLIMLGIILVGFPAGSWYYLQKGLDYQRAIQQDLGELGAVKPFSLEVLQGKEIDFEFLKGSVIVVAHLDRNDSEMGNKMGTILFQLHDQFDDRDDVLFLIHSNNSPETIQGFLDKHQLNDPEQCFFVAIDNDSQFKQTYFIPNAEKASQTLAVVDVNGMVRKHYNATDPKDLKVLVEHITLLFPRQAEKDLIFKRETEK